MTPNEYRQKHKRCATCKYFNKNSGSSYFGFCTVKGLEKRTDNGILCRVYKAKEFNEND